MYSIIIIHYCTNEQKEVLSQKWASLEEDERKKYKAKTADCVSWISTDAQKNKVIRELLSITKENVCDLFKCVFTTSDCNSLFSALKVCQVVVFTRHRFTHCLTSAKPQ